MMKKNWIFKLASQIEITALAQELKIHPAIAHVLIQRKITKLDLAKDFFNPSLDQLHDPFLMKGMRNAVQRILQAMGRNEKILIYGDYDVDGSTSVAMFYSFMKEVGANVEFYIPDRHVEGYGLSTVGVNFAAAKNFSLIITLDCGTRDVKNVAFANTLGIEVVISDHHEPGEVLPDALAILNPKQKDCSYPFRELSGCGVGFKLMHALVLEIGIPVEKIFIYLDFVAVSIACDIVPMVEENRVLIHFGLKKLFQNPLPGLKALLDLAGMHDEEISVSDLVFGVGPRINAAGRLEHASISVDALLSQNFEEAKVKAQKLELFNTRRKEIDIQITTEALDMISKDPKSHGAKTTVLYNPHWHKGVIGIVASRCVERYYRPTVILTLSQGMATGSARSVAGFNLYNAIVDCADLLERYGGHAFAAGLTLPVENIPLFKEKFEEVVSRTISEECLLLPQIINSYMPLSEVNDKFFKLLNRMAPFGPGNMQPIFMEKNVVAYHYEILKENHLKIYIKHKRGAIIEGIGFGLAHCEDFIRDKKPFEMAYSIEESNFGGLKSLCVRVRDVRRG